MGGHFYHLIGVRQTNMMKSAQSTSEPRENLGSEEAQRQMKALDKRVSTWDGFGLVLYLDDPRVDCSI